MNLNIIDVESDDLYPYDRKIWVVVINKPLENKKLIVHPFMDKDAKEKILQFIKETDKEGSEIPIIAGHNILGFDLWTIWRLLDIKPVIKTNHYFADIECRFWDTLYMSRYLYPDLDGQSLKRWGERLGYPKMDYRGKLIEMGMLENNSPDGAEFKFFNPIMIDYCVQDTVVTSKLFLQLYDNIVKTNQESQYMMSQWSFFLMVAQGFTGFPFDIEYGNQLKEEIEAKMKELKDEVEPLLPPRPLKKTEEAYYKIPKKAYNNKGQLTATFTRWLEKLGAELINERFFEYQGKVYEIIPDKVIDINLPMLIDDQQHMKQWFLDLGWKPTLWNFKKDEKGKIIRDENFEPIQTSPKIQENGRVCPNLDDLEGDLAKKVVKYLSYKNRYAVLCGWLENPRLSFDGRLTPGFSGITPTFRMKHTTIVNVPKAQPDILLGYEFRSLFTASKGNKLIGCDQSALEARCEAHWVYDHDPKFAIDLIEGDPHSRNAKAFFPEEVGHYDITSKDFNKDDPKFKPWRSKSKNMKYAIMYGASPAKIASTGGKPEEEGYKLFDAFWTVNVGLKKLRDKLMNEFQHNKGWIRGIDGRRLNGRSPHSLINLLFQSTASVIMEVSLILFDLKMGEMYIDDLGRPYYLYQNKYVSRVGYYHDEMIVDCDPEIAETVGKIMEECMEKSGKFLKIKVPLKGEAMIGQNWKETH